MRVAASLLTICLLGLPAAALAQYDEPAEHSIIRQTGFGWRNHVEVADGCGCSVPVRTDCYDQPCCFRCGLRPLCFLQRVHRMLDCLLPCKKCCCLLGGRCGGCCGPSCSTGCGGEGLPGFSDPFVDDALVPPKPIADPGTEVRFQPPPPRRLPASPPRTIVNRPATVAKPAPVIQPRYSPYKVTNPPPAQHFEQRVSHAPRHAAAGEPAIRFTAEPARIAVEPARIAAEPARIAVEPRVAKPVEQSVLRRTSADEPAPFEVEPEVARPIIRSQSPPDDGSDYAIPHNPLRSR